MNEFAPLHFCPSPSFRVPAAHIARVNGVQNALQSIMDMLAFVLGIIFSQPSDWNILVCCMKGEESDLYINLYEVTRDLTVKRF